jgi:hypothetical protein
MCIMRTNSSADQLSLRVDRLVNFDYSEKVKALLSKLEEFLE